MVILEERLSSIHEEGAEERRLASFTVQHVSSPSKTRSAQTELSPGTLSVSRDDDEDLEGASFEMVTPNFVLNSQSDSPIPDGRLAGYRPELQETMVYIAHPILANRQTTERPDERRSEIRERSD